MRPDPLATLTRRARRSTSLVSSLNWNTKRELQRLLLVTFALGCGETPNAPKTLTPPDPIQVVARINCIGNTQTQQVSCASADAGSVATSLAPSSALGPRYDIILGGQNTFVKLTSSNVAYSGNVFSFNTTVTNLIGQALGTTDGTTLAASGVRVFFQDPPAVTAGTGTIDFVDPVGGGSLVDGFATFTTANQAYYQYNELLATNATSAAKAWRIHMPPTVTQFSFKVFVSAPVQFPTGWIDVSPTTATLQPTQTQALTATVRDATGQTLTGQTVTWASSNTSAATVDANTGVVTAVADGSATITATSTTRTGTSTITVASVVGSIAINAGDGQTAASGAAVATAPSVIVKNASNTPMAGVTVTFSVTGGGGSATSTTATTNASGIATVGNWTLGSGGAGCSATSIASCSRNALHAVATGGSNPSVDFKGFIPPIVPTATYQAVGNATLTIPTGTGVLAGAFSINGNGANGTGATLAVTTPTPTGSNGGTATIATDGGFTYLSSPTFVSAGAATENFTVGVTDAIAASNANATLQLNVPEHVWYVSPGYTGTSVGSDVQPFKDLSTTAGQGVESVAANNDTILVLSGSGVAAGGTLKNGQVAYGQGASAAKLFATGSVATYRNGGMTLTLLATGSTPSIGALTLASTNTLRGITLTGTGGSAALTGTTFGTANISETFVTTAVQALNLTSGNLVGALASTTSTGGTNNVSLSSVTTSGTFALGGGTLVGATGDAFKINGGSGTFTYSGSIANAATLAVNIASMSGGAVTLSGSINTTAAPGAGISITNNTAGTVTLSGSQIGVSTTGAMNGVTMTGNSAPVVVAMTPTALQVATATGTGLLASGAGSLSITGAGNAITSTGGTGLSLSNISVNAPGITFNSVTSGGGTNNVLLSTVGGTGTIALGGGALSGATGTSFLISGSNANPVTYGGTITKTVAGQIAAISNHTAGTIDLSGALTCNSACGSGSGAINVSNNSGGTIQFSGSSKTLSNASSGNIGVNVVSNNGATVAFPNGGLAITTSTGAGFNATTNGTVTVTGSNNAITTTTGTALNVNGVTIGASGLVFKSITSNGAANGIFLSATGTSGGLTVTGDGTTPGSGGTIQNIVGADNATAGNGIYLSNTRNVSLSWIALTNTNNSAIFGTAVRSVFIDHAHITGTIGNKPAAGSPRESPIHFEDVGGPVKVQNSRLDGSAHDGFLLDNSSGTAPVVDSLVLASDTVSTMQGSLADVFANTGLQVILADGSADVRIRNNSVTFWWGNAIQVAVSGTATATARITGNTANQTSGALAGAGGIWVNGGNLAYNISNNNVQGTNGTAISADRNPGNFSFNGTIDSNIIGTSGVSNSGSGTGIAIFASHTGPGTTTTRISNNTIRQIAGSANGAITALTGDDVGGGGSGTMNATIVGNDIQESGTPTNSAQHGILVTHGRVTGDTDLGCYDIGGAGALANSITNFNTATGGAAVNRIRINERFLTTARFPGYTGLNNDNAGLGTYLLGRNTASNTANANNVSVGGNGFQDTTPPGSACTQPSM